MYNLSFLVAFSFFSLLFSNSIQTEECIFKNNPEDIFRRTEVPPLSFLPMRMSYDVGLVTDLDKASRDPFEFLWRSYFYKGTLTRLSSGNFTFEIHSHKQLESRTAYKNRSMELSELVVFNSNLLAFCDITGIVYKIGRDDLAYQRWALADGNGKEVKPFKSEWATVKDNLLYVGSLGCEWVQDEQVKHYGPEWVKIITPEGSVENHDWSWNFKELRKATNTSQPGYLFQEAVVWHPVLNKWAFLPRRASSHIFNVELDDYRGTNLLLLASENFDQVDVTRVGELEQEYGFSSVKVIPDSGEFLAIKVREVDGHTRSLLTVFDQYGNFKLEPEPYLILSEEYKFEGLEIL